MSIQNENVWYTLQQAGLVQGDLPESDTLDSPWYIKLLLAISGWLASLFLLGFLGVQFEVIFHNPSATLLVGSMMIAAAFALLRIPKNEFYEHIALAVSFAGHGLIVWTIFDNTSEKTAWLLTSLLLLVLTLIMSNYVHRVLSSFFTASCFSITLMLAGIPYIASSVVMFAAAFLWLHEFSFTKYMPAKRAVGYGLVLALIQMKGSSVFSFSPTGWRTFNSETQVWIQPWMGEVLAGAVALYVVWHILERHGHKLSDPVTIAALIGTIILTVISIEARGITVGMLILILGFSGSNRVLMGLGIASLLFYISSYYYLLDITLLEKSQTLLIVGLALFATRWLLLRIVPADKEVPHG